MVLAWLAGVFVWATGHALVLGWRGEKLFGHPEMFTISLLWPVALAPFVGVAVGRALRRRHRHRRRRIEIPRAIVESGHDT